MKRTLLILAACTVIYGCTGNRHTPCVWSLRADSTSVALAECFWDSDRNYLDYDSAGDTTFHYWPQAHGLDVFTDWYLRTGDVRAKDLFDKWFEGVPAANGGGWWNQFYDDMEWNAIATLRVYEATGDGRFLEASKELWEFIKPAWNDRGGGGMTWKKGMEWSKNACSNGPAGIIAARLYDLEKDPEDLEWARRIFDWEYDHLYEPAQGLIYDNVDGRTGTVQNWCFTYNQGTFMGLAHQLWKLTGERSYLNIAVKTASYTIGSENTVRDGVLKDEGNGDGGLFKGIFIRYFVPLVLDGSLSASERKKFDYFLVHCAETLWKEATPDREDPLFGPSWSISGGTVDLGTQVSGAALLEGMAYYMTNK